MPHASLPRPPQVGVVVLTLALGLACDRRSPVTVAAPARAAAAPDVAAAIDAQLRHAGPRNAGTRDSKLAALYAARQYRPIWSEDETLLPAAESLVSAIAASADRGLDPARYQVEKLRRRVVTCGGARSSHPAVRRRRLAECDLLLSRAFLELSRDLAVGRMSARRAGIRWHTAPRKLELGARMLAAARSGRIEPALDVLELRHPGYVELKRALAAMRAIEARGGWPSLPETPKRFAADPRAKAKLRRRLEASGDLGAGAAGGDELIAALGRFQARHGLAASGKIDAATLAELNVPAAERRRQIELNLERWRWLPESLGARHVLVNVAAYELALVERGERRFVTRVVVGKPYQQTPAFSDVIEKLELNPYWNVPASIVESEIVPAIREDSGYLAKQNMEVVGEGGGRLEIRQRPGPGNALGKIKFVLPNEHNIYLHDTPAEELFERTVRSFSHGCIRLEAPLDLAARLLAGEPGWNRRRLEAVIANGDNRFVRLSNPVPVHILYWTAWVDERGELQIRRDPYDIDAKLARALRRSKPA
jgi:murein L,D-transpeptidase YcbB/YkuD